ncbi:hypothetical protein Tco_1575610 [Tanacetum coccineum]
MLEVRRPIRSEKECLGVRRDVRSRKTIRSETTTRSKKTIEGEKNNLEVKRPFEVREDVARCEDQDLYVRGFIVK